jgi:hypothetical protein
MEPYWTSLSNNISDPRLKTDIESAVHVGLGERQNPEVRINQANDLIVISVTVAGNTWRSKGLPLHDKALGMLEFEIIRPLQQWARAGFPDREFASASHFRSAK